MNLLKADKKNPTSSAKAEYLKFLAENTRFMHKI